MKAFSTLLVFVLSISTLFAQTGTKQIDYQKWDELVQYTIDYGRTIQFPLGYLKSISYETPATGESSHRREFFSVVGDYDRAGNFIPQQVSIVSENWQINSNGNWDIHQWSFTAGIKGKLKDVKKRYLLETPEGRVLDYRSLPVGEPDSSEVQEFWQKKMAQWFTQVLQLSPTD